MQTEDEDIIKVMDEKKKMLKGYDSDDDGLQNNEKRGEEEDPDAEDRQNMIESF
jgi:hypothetical protein